MISQKLLSLPFSFFNRKAKYPGIIQRSCTITLDLMLIMLILSPCSYCLDYLVLNREAFVEFKTWQNAQIATGAQGVNLVELRHYLVDSGLLQRIIIKNVLLGVIGSALLVLSWYYTQTTPGKWFFRLYIVDSKTGGKPTFRQLLLRAFGLIITLAPLGFSYLFIFTNEKRQAIHDYMSGTLVVKREAK